jgi:UDP-GlcNAc:undecaprenyl-phosphate GlcNAc-1-phosphate transferase
MADMIMAVVRRTKAGRSPFSADKQHLHHRLLQIGHSKQRAVLIMYLWAALISAAVILVTVTAAHRPPIFIAMGVCGVMLIALLFPRSRRLLDLRAARRTSARHAASGRRRGAPTAPPTAKVGVEPQLPDLVHSAPRAPRPPA